MKKKIIILLFVALSFFFFRASLFAAEYSLDDLYRMALERSDSIKIAEENLYISEREKDTAVADLIPTLSAFGQHTRYSSEKRSSGFLLQPEYTNEWGLRLYNTYSLGGKEFTALDISGQGIRQRRLDLYAAQENYLWNVAVQYYDVLRVKQEIEIAAANVRRLTTERDAAKKRLEVGTAIKTAVLRAEAELSSAKSESIRAENELKVAKNILAKTVRISGEYKVKEPWTDIEATMPYDGEIDLTPLTGNCRGSVLECLKELALSERAEIKSSTIGRDMSKNSIKLEKSRYWPELSIEGVYFREENDPSATFALNERIYGGVRLDFPLFEGGLKKAKVGQAKSRLRQAEYSLYDLERDISVTVENSYIIATTAGALLKPRQAEVAFARENYNLVSKQFKYGLADSVDVMDANTRLVTSERNLLRARYVYVLAILRLKRETGTLLKSVVSSQQSAVSGGTRE